MIKVSGNEIPLPTNLLLAMKTWEDKQLMVRRTESLGIYQLYSEASPEWVTLADFIFDDGKLFKSYQDDPFSRPFNILTSSNPKASFSLAGQAFHLILKEYQLIQLEETTNG